ncbi:hypothetical protein TA3x_002293 [Tundrisphaera sp. TA3]|uniref:hypothetical protein n=1 Tax=Tundrisphaera sp. TA3 TaxID=3435775 RepID=UPI003EBA7598
MIDPRIEATRLRSRDPAPQESAIAGGRAAASASPLIVAQTKALTTYPTAAQRFFACRPIMVLGAEVEGGLGTITADSATVLALNLGAGIPPSGTNVVLSYCANRWVFIYN